jgi:hypothetical protein
MVACSLYLDLEGMDRFATTVSQAISQGNKKTAVIAVSGLSGHWHKIFLPYSQDQGLPAVDDSYNRRFLSLLETGEVGQAVAMLPDYGRKCHVDMGGKALPFLVGAGVASDGHNAHVTAYGSIYGTGAAVVRFPVP